MPVDALKPKHLKMLFIAMGFATMITQVVLLRELVVFFSGNEMTVGIILTFWLVGTAFGSGLSALLSKRIRRPELLFMLCQFMLMILLPISLVVIRLAKAFFSIPLGETIPPSLILFVPLLALVPACLIMGFLYPLGCQILSRLKTISDVSIPGQVYLYEAIGSGIAGFIASIFLFRFLENFQIILLIWLLYLLSALFLGWMTYRKLRAWIAGATGLLGVLFISYAAKFDAELNRRAWAPLNLLRTKTTIYGNIAVTQWGDLISFYENGVIMFSHPDPMAAEEAVHFALLQHPEPRRVLLIGGDAAGILPQVIQHPSVERVDLVLLDPTAMTLAKQYIPPLNEILKDDRFHIWYRDGRLFLKQSAQRFDVIIVNLPEPRTAMINRFYTREFFELAKNHLMDRGIMSFSIPSSENVLSEEQTVLLSCLYQTMRKSFLDIVLIPGSSVHFIGCIASGILTSDLQILVQRLNQRQLHTLYVREYYFPFRMTPARMQYIAEKVVEHPARIINRDFQPIGYFYSLMLWLTTFKIDLTVLLRMLTQGRIWIFAMFIAAGCVTLLGWNIATKNRRGPKSIVPMAILMIGFVAISLEIVIILGFQAIYGYAYYQVALIISGFMIGLMSGSWVSLRNVIEARSHIRDFILFQMMGVIYPLFTWMVFLALAQITLPAILVQLVFFILISGLGFIAGYQFPLANLLLCQPGQRVERVGGTLYAVDLFGSVIGVLLTSIVLVPIIGLGFTAIFFSLLNFSVVLALMRFWKMNQA
ncbi:MAG: fused MFS/spermidine synthase [candidate division KSB1 bacterium]|nr:fused MFS/spermidine synthase [candidate division KSB1 bacterium]MDZ7334295.1 fused MFS/spermidine synthase [candidate division KSB1 bacterium]MDZ7356487.1 fused MFS/spermidine synthase [candidate division KSB1 bacterium]MDZ7400494.1 fused MFS/spermidine synthase [candidate division KSB1 bacterium]